MQLLLYTYKAALKQNNLYSKGNKIMKLSENIKTIRKAKGLRQEQLAEAMGVSTASVSKWETGQTAPELTVLADLADFFEVSIDTLIGHQVTGNRMNTMLAEMEQFENDDDYEKAREIAEKLLQCYPNEFEVVDKTANLYYRIYTCTRDVAAMEKCIALTKSELALVDDPNGTKKFEIYSSLGNQYAMLGDYEQSRKYYNEGNIANVNDRALAGILANEGKNKEAVVAISDIFVENLFYMMTDVLQLHGSWQALGEADKAEEALLWGITVLDVMTGDAVSHLIPMKNTMYLLLAMSAEEREDAKKADEYIQKAVLSAQNSSVEKAQYDFLECTKAGKLLGTNPTTPEMIIQMLEALGAERLVEVAKNM